MIDSFAGTVGFAGSVVVAVPGTVTTPVEASFAASTPVQSQATGTATVSPLVPASAGTVVGAAAFTWATETPAYVVSETGWVPASAPTSTVAVAWNVVPKTSVPDPGTVFEPGVDQSMPEVFHVTDA